MTAIRLGRPVRRWLVLVVTGALLWLLLCLDPDEQRSAERTGPAAAGCDALYRLSSALQREETGPERADRPPLCRTPQLGERRLRACLRRRLQRQRRPTAVLLVGDSRLRMLYRDLGERLNVSAPVPEAHADAEKRGLDHGSPPAQFCAADPRWCDFSAASPALALRFLWRPFLNEHAVRALADEADGCSAAPAGCPHLVLLDAGLWYTRALLPDGSGAAWQMALLFRRQAARAAHEIGRLARLTRVVWRLDERVLFDLFGEQMGLPLLLALHALVYELQQKVPQLVVWSSALPVSTDPVRRLCLPLRDRGAQWDPALAALFNEECGDAIHGSRRVRARYADTVLADLCGAAGRAAAAADGRPCCDA